MESNNVFIINQIRKDIEEKLNEQIASITQIDNAEDLEELIKNVDFQKLEEEVCKKYNQPPESPVSLKFSLENEEELWTTLNSVDYDDFDKISQNLNHKKTISTQLRALDKLLLAYVIDTKQKSWLPLSRNLQECLISFNDEVFKKSLQIHHKLLSTPTVCSEGYLNLIHTLILMFNNEELFKNVQEINESNKFHKRALKILKLLLKSQNVLLKNWLHAKHKVIEEVLITFIYMLNYSMGNEHHLGVLDFLAVLDPQAQWFKKFCYSLQTRLLILGCLRRTSNLIKHFVGTFLDFLENDPSSQRHFSNFSHAVYFLQQFLMYHQNFSIFPVRIKTSQEIVTFESFIVFVTSKINTESESPKRRILVAFSTAVLTVHARLILNIEIQKKLFEPFISKGSNRRELNSNIERSRHVVDVMNKLSKSSIMSNCLNLKKLDRKYARSSYREKHTNPLQIIMNATVTSVRNFINHSESQHYILHDVLFELIDCCQNLFGSHKRSFTVINFNKLVLALKDFYKTLTNHDTYNNHYKIKIAMALSFFIVNDYLTLNTIESESGFLHEIVCNALMNTNSFQDYGNLILSIADCKEGFSTISSNHDTLIKQHLIKIWAMENTEENLHGLDEEMDKFLSVINVITYNFKAVEALLNYENEGTITGNQEGSLILTEIIENCLDIMCSCTSEAILGLKMTKLLITNIDVLLYLQHNYKLQENLIELQVNSRMPCSDEQDSGDLPDHDATAMIIDECSSLRHNILLSIKYAGWVDAALNEKMLDQAKFIAAPARCSGGLRTHNKTPNELQKFLHNTKHGLHDHSWIVQARRAYKVVIKEPCKISTIPDLIEQVPKLSLHSDLMWPPAGTVLLGLFPEEYHAATIVVRFGIQNGLLQSALKNEENLLMLLRQSKTFLNHKVEEFAGNDWFVTIIFLICSGSLEKSKNLLLNIVNTSVGPIIWPAFAAALNVKQSICDRFYRQLEVIVEDTMRVGCALQMLGVSVRHVAKKWLEHCFFTLLEFNEICNFLILAVLYPTEYVMFYIIAILEHMKSDIFTAAHMKDFKSILRITKIIDFRINNWIGFMDKLYRQYKNS